MTEITKAPIESQLGDDICLVEDTAEIFWLRELDDYQSRVSLGNVLAAQYRFKEAIEAYNNAMRIRQNDWRLLYRLGGAYLTIRQFSNAMAAYYRCLEISGKEEAVSFPLGIACYLQNDYDTAITWFKKCFPCDDEMSISVIYWHTLSCYRADHKPTLLGTYYKDMEVGHHAAYKLAVSVFCGETNWEDALEQLAQEKDDLNYIISLYGLCGYLDQIGEQIIRKHHMASLLNRNSIWPCISYLAAWGDVNNKEGDDAL